MSGLRRKLEKIARKWILASPGKEEKNSPKIRKIAENGILGCFGAILTFLGPFFSSYFPGDARIHFWGVAKGSSVSWVAKFKGDKISECKLSNGWSRS